jgi:hypothetical protein
VFLDQLRFEAALTVARNLEVNFTKLPFEPFLADAVARVAFALWQWFNED